MDSAPTTPAAAPPPEIVDVATLTPMMKQYLEVKAQHPGALLFFRLGDFYELFFEDAVKAAELLQITLTSRAKGLDRVPMAGVPYHAAKRYIARLIEAGQKVAVCEQLEPPGKGIVKREVVRVITPGMVLDDDVLEARENNFLGALNPADADEAWGAALLDASTGEFFALQPGPLEALLDELSRASPKELLVPEGFGEAELERVLGHFTRRPTVATLPQDAFEQKRARASLSAHFQVKSLDGFGLTDSSASVGAAGAALRYLKETQKSQAGHVDRLTVSTRGGALIIDEASRANLELLRTLKDNSRAGSLIGVIDRSVTPLGARRIARWLTAPLADVEAIKARHDAVQALVESASFRETLVEALKQVADVERLCGRLSLSSGGPRDLKAMARSLEVLPGVAKVVATGKAALLQALSGPLDHSDVRALSAVLSKALVEDPPAVVGDGGFIAKGYHAQLDEYAELASTGKDYLAKLETREREATGIGSLKVRYNRVFGYYLEVTKSNLHLVPKEWIRKQTTVGGERYVTEELKTYEEKVLTADEKRVAIELELFEALRKQVVACAGPLRAAAEAVSTLDALVSFARVAVENNYVRPEIDESAVLEITGGRHPVVEKALREDSFVPNDVLVNRQDRQVLIITGPNMAGKSTVMRQAALAVVMGQAGSFVAAKKARIGLCDRVFTRVGASDNLAKGQSTFMVEMTETANILHHATRKSLVVLDEIGRGTSTFDGLSIAWAVAEHLHDRVGARTLFATHYHELTDLGREKARVKNCSIAVREDQGRVIFLRKLVDGAASRSYGIEVARLAGLPPEVLARARELLANLEAGEFDETGRPRLARRATAAVKEKEPKAAPIDKSQISLFGGGPKTPERPNAEAVLAALEAFSVDTTTPLEALTAIARWKASLKGP
ncbi:MAG: DNA mismatch repair protein MutS [Archangiaceae bacterium]|nr:DNA mismatch repair protein MutS [Archangiaceae bacterium]